VALAVCLGLSAGRVWAGDGDQAKAESDKAMAEFGLGNYAEAARHYEAAFRLKPDGALLYNAARAYEMSGNKQRALELYKNYVLLYKSDKHQTAEAKRHVATLEQQVGQQPAATTPPPPPPAAAPAPVAAAPAPAPAPRPAPVLTAPPPAPPPSASAPQATLVAPAGAAEPAPKKSSHAWIWIVGGALVVTSAVALLFVLSPENPTPSFGMATGN
jgi:tetratricopeptide (TPR) repeat protein